MPQPAKILHEKHDIVSFFLGRHPSAGSCPALQAWSGLGRVQEKQAAIRFPP
jgi:hypothetical protein